MVTADASRGTVERAVLCDSCRRWSCFVWTGPAGCWGGGGMWTRAGRNAEEATRSGGGAVPCSEVNYYNECGERILNEGKYTKSRLESLCIWQH